MKIIASQCSQQISLYQNKPLRDTSRSTCTWRWFKPNLFCAHLWLEPITQSEVGPKTSLTMDKGVNGHELYLRIWNLDDRHEVYIRNWRNMFQLNYLDRENIFNTVQQGTLTQTLRKKLQKRLWLKPALFSVLTLLSLISPLLPIFSQTFCSKKRWQG